MNTVTEKSEILFLYETKYNIPNGDPFTGEPRYDEETKKALVSDVRLKRYIRDNMYANGHPVYVINPDLDNKMTSGQRFKALYDVWPDKNLSPRDFALTLTDVRMFGGVMAIQQDKKTKGKGKKNDETGDTSDETNVTDGNVGAFNVTGPIQFAILNPSLNSVNMMMNQRTSVLVSKEGNEQGSIATRYLIPYTIMQAHAWINPFNAKITKLTQDDVTLMFRSLWNEINSKNTTSKTDQSSLLILQIVYKDPNDKLYGADRFVKIRSATKQEEQLRSLEDFEFDWSALKTALDSPKVQALRYYTEIESIESELKGFGSTKIEKLKL
ncbi:type I CRISPR-associated protein Cas7 [Mucilaginibacter sp.]|uniref:type I CRISPR-associated protein Cas7 n=1 Tax=Mucilaginibacter sp. TaxID=1882438 RepID=UPI00283BE0E4|nr:type I CRISPR-associated protein Cas7 [Mucilaginibacter sp.]MDR3695603.1 type I CRISPR-associated protein Cas7 [Mucilaginibacter sp.]